MADQAHFILYVRDPERSAAFYAQVLGAAPRLQVPGMTEFALGGGCVLGLMPVAGAERLLGAGVVGTAREARAELYLHVDDVRAWYDRARRAGAREVSPPQPRDWGHEAAYVLDPDGHVLAFARAGVG